MAETKNITTKKSIINFQSKISKIKYNTNYVHNEEPLILCNLQKINRKNIKIYYLLLAFSDILTVSSLSSSSLSFFD